MGRKKNTPAKAFEIVGVVPGPIRFKGNSYDLSELTPEEVDYLIENECEYIKLKAEENAETPAE